MDKHTKTNTKIGIGVTTTPNRKGYVDKWLECFNKVKPKGYHLHIHDDVHYKGVAYSKNQNLKTLKGCEHIFLFDDDCYPIKNGWAEYFIESLENHLLYLQPNHNIYAKRGNLEMYRDCGGVFMYLNKRTFDKVGYFNSEYGQYGFEHAGYSNRIHKAGLTSSPYQQLKDTDKYLLAMDYSGQLCGVVKQFSISEAEKQKQININRNVFLKELQSPQIFYNFAE